MSLDLYVSQVLCPCRCGKEHTGTLDHTYHQLGVTHNLVDMAKEAGVYRVLWRCGEEGIETAGQLVAPLREGLARMRQDPDRFERHNPENGWGDYDGFVRALSELLESCTEHPDARVEHWR
jgi:hypothetical protein